MTSSASSPVSLAIAGYVAGHVKAERLVALVATAYYGVGGKRDGLKPLMDVIERAAPGVVELAAAANRPGFLIKAAERPFPREYETQLRVAVQVVLGSGEPGAGSAASVRSPGLLSRMLAAIRGVFR